MKPDRFQVRDEAIDELDYLINILFECADYINDDINEHGELVPDTHAVLRDKLFESAFEIFDIVRELKNNLAVFPITPRGFRLEIYDVVNRAERLLREYELLD
jgi:hypothetical protein